MAASDPQARRFARYPTYKDSGVEWLGEIPAHWEVNRTKFAARLRSGHTPSRQHPEYWENCTIPWFGLADVWQIRDGRTEFVYETAEKISELGLANSAARLLPKNTVILSRTASVGFSAILGVDMATTQDFVNWICGQKLRPEYLLYVFRSMGHEFRRLTMGSTHQTIYMPDVGAFSTPIPSLVEQDRIATFIRDETARIDALVTKKERLIELLREKRAALITRAVTEGLDPNVPMKDSGIEWLGEIPAPWQVKRLWHLTPSDRRIMYGIVLPGPNVDDGVPIVRGGDVSPDRLRLDRLNRTTREIESGHVRSRLRGGDLVYAIRGSIGEVAIVPDENLLFDQYLRGHRNAEDLIRGGESQTLEFKSTLRWNLKENRKDDKGVTHAVLKTIAAFLNTEGGDLLIGVADDKSIVGIETDQLDGDDKFMRHLIQVVNNGLGDRVGVCVDPRTQIVSGKTVCVVSCRRSPEAVFLKWKGIESQPEGDFFVRKGPRTDKLSPESAAEYI